LPFGSDPKEAGTSVRSGLAAALYGNAYFILVVGSLCWSGNHLLGRAIAGHVPPVGIATLRWAVGAAILWPFARHYLGADWPEIRRHIGVIAFLALTGGTLFGVLQYVGLQLTTALNVSVLNSVTPVLIAAAGALLFRDRLTGRQAIGLATSLAGVVVIVTKADLHVLAAFTFNVGDLIILFNMLVWGIYSACLRLRPRVHWLSFMFVFAAISTLGSLPLAVAEQIYGFRFQPTLLTAFTVFYVSVFTSVIAFVAWTRGVELIGPNRAGVFLHLIPLFTAVLSGVLIGEHIMAYHFVGFALILAGVWLAGRA
jgi:drug/metabolite transporter (DMT)-like permease